MRNKNNKRQRTQNKKAPAGIDSTTPRPKCPQHWW
jgi:hypothetical protein